MNPVPVIAKGNKDKNLTVHRVWGYLVAVKGSTATIGLSDGLTITKPLHMVATYTQPPPNWEELYREQERITSKEPTPKTILEN